MVLYQKFSYNVRNIVVNATKNLPWLSRCENVKMKNRDSLKKQLSSIESDRKRRKLRKLDQRLFPKNMCFLKNLENVFNG